MHLHNLMMACILGKDMIVMGHSNFDLDIIHVILYMFDNDWVARSLLWVKLELDKDFKFFSDMV